MELDVGARGGAGYDETNAERINGRNGYQHEPVPESHSAVPGAGDRFAPVSVSSAVEPDGQQPLHC